MDHKMLKDTVRVSAFFSAYISRGSGFVVRSSDGVRMPVDDCNTHERCIAGSLAFWGGKPDMMLRMDKSSVYLT